MGNKREFNLNLRQQRFCELFVRNGANAVRAYIVAYGIDASNPHHYKSAKSSASRLLNRPYLKLYAKIIFNKDFIREWQ